MQELEAMSQELAGPLAALPGKVRTLLHFGVQSVLERIGSKTFKNALGRWLNLQHLAAMAFNPAGGHLVFDWESGWKGSSLLMVHFHPGR